MTQVSINGNTYSDDGSTPKDMLNGGHRTNFFPLVSDVVTVAGQVSTNAAQSAIDTANSANYAAATRGTSVTSTTVSVGSKVMATQSGKQFVVGNYVTIARTSAPTTLMHGVVTAYSGTSLTVDVATIAGSGTYTDWTIALSGAKGNTGATGNGDVTYLAKSGAYTVVTTDKGKLINCTGTFTLSFQACATLGANWTTYIRNSGTGVITLDPNGSETINGVATYNLQAGSIAMITGDGTVLRVAFATTTETVRLPIFSAETANYKPLSALEDIFNLYPDTLLGSVAVGSVFFTNSLFVAVPTTSSGNISTSPDGRTWTLRAMPSTAPWVVGADTAGLVASQNNSTSIARSTNSTTWVAGTSLPGNASYYIPAVVSGVTLVVANAASTLYRSADYGLTAWTTQTTPTAISAVAGVMPVKGMPGFWYHSAGTTAYTSPTGLTGSWTLRTLPITPTSAWPDQYGNVWIYGSGTHNYKTADGVNWVDMGEPLNTSGGNLVLNGVEATSVTTIFGNTKTRTNGISTLRTSKHSVSFYRGYNLGAVVGNVSVFHNISETDGKVCLIDAAAADAATAIYTR